MDGPRVIDVKSKTILPKLLYLTTVETPDVDEIYSVNWTWLCYNKNQDYFNL